MAFRTQKISQMTPKGADLEATDLIEVSTIESGSYVTRSITGQELIDAIPLPPSGITIGTTAITSGTVGRVLFEGTGNVVQESANLFWDNTNGRLGIGTSSPTAPLQITTSGLVTALYINTGNDGGFTSQNNGTLALNRTTQVRLVNGSTFFGANDRSYQLVNIGKSATASDFFIQYWDGSSYLERFRVFATGNFAINTTTDAGFKLDVNGTARVQNTATIVGTNPFLFINNNSTGLMGVGFQNAGTDQAYTGIASAAGAGIAGSLTHDYFIRSLGRRILFTTTGGAIQAMLFSTGNFAINTTTDAGFRLDVNGTARVKDAGSELAITSPLSAIAPVIFTTKGASGGYRGGYNFKGGFGGNAGNTIFIIDTTNTDAGSRGGFGNFLFSDLVAAKFTIDNTQTGGRNAALRLRGNFVNNYTEYNGIDFNAYTGTDIGGFIGSQRNSASSGYGADIVVLATLDSGPSTYLEVARFIGRYNSFYVGTDKTLAVASAKMQVESTTQGFLPPRMTTTQKNAIATPATGLQIYDSTLNRPCFYDGTTWITL